MRTVSFGGVFTPPNPRSDPCMARITPNGATVRRHFEQARDARPRAISGKEPPHDILTHRFPAYVCPQQPPPAELLRPTINEPCPGFLPFRAPIPPAWRR